MPEKSAPRKRTLLAMLDQAAATFTQMPYAYKKTDAGFEPASFEQVRDRARDFAAWLLSHGFERGDTVAIIAEGSPEWIIGEFGALLAGCISVPLSIKLLREELPFRLEHSGAKAVLTSKNQFDKVLGSLSATPRQDVLIIYLDADLAWARETARKAGFPVGSVFGFDEALGSGAHARKDAHGRTASDLVALAERIEEDDVVSICYTSGTTGNPKGIMLTHLNYWTNCHDGATLFQMPRDLRTLIILPVDHSFAHTAGLYAALIVGTAIYFVDSRGGGIATLRNIPLNLREVEPNLLLTVPALSGNFMRKIVGAIEERGGLIEKLFKTGIVAGTALNGDGFHPPSFGTRLKYAVPYFLIKNLVFERAKRMVFGKNLEYCVGGGALLDIRQQEFFAAFGVPIYQGYGLTEAAPVISSNSPRDHKFGTSGKLCPSIECKIVKSDGSIAKRGETGQIVIRGDNVMKGYFRNPEATAAALRDGWLHTGDLAYLDEDDFLVVVGREKALLIAEDGEKYSPEEIEEAVASSTDVIEHVMAWCEQKKYVVALVALDRSRVERIVREQRISESHTLLALLKNEFERYKADPKAKRVQSAWMPAVFQIVERGFSEADGTVNSTMKLVRHRVAAVHAELLEYSYGLDGAKTINERNLAALRSMFDLA